MTGPRRAARAPWVTGPDRRLGTRTPLEHLDDLVRLLLLTGPRERLHRPGLGAGLGASALFAPLSPDLGGVIAARARGGLVDTLGDRLEVVELAVTVADTTVSARVVYRPRPAGPPREVALDLPAAGGGTP